MATVRQQSVTMAAFSSALRTPVEYPGADAVAGTDKQECKPGRHAENGDRQAGQQKPCEEHYAYPFKNTQRTSRNYPAQGARDMAGKSPTGAGLAPSHEGRPATCPSTMHIRKNPDGPHHCDGGPLGAAAGCRRRLRRVRPHSSLAVTP